MLQLKYQDDGLIPAIIQDRHSGKGFDARIHE